MFESDVVVECPNCRAVPNLDQMNERREAGAGVFGCGTCGKVEAMTVWIRVTGRIRQK